MTLPLGLASSVASKSLCRTTLSGGCGAELWMRLFTYPIILPTSVLFWVEELMWFLYGKNHHHPGDGPKMTRRD